MPTNKELEKRLGAVENKVDSILVAMEVKDKPEEGPKPWALDKFPPEWVELGTEYVVVRDKAERTLTFNGVTIPLIKGVPWEVPANIAKDLKEKGWA